MERVAIVGAGPGGMFTAYELVKDKVLKHKFDITVIEKSGHVGGSGGRIDGKFNYHPEVGFWPPWLIGYCSKERAEEILNQIGETFRRYVKPDVYYDEEKSKELKAKSIKARVTFIPIRQEHIGSERLPSAMKKFKKDLEKEGVKFRLKTKAENLEMENGRIVKILTDKGPIKCDHAVLAPGRNSNYWLKQQCDKFGIETRNHPLDIGVRVEVLNEIIADIVENYRVHDPKFHIYTKRNDDLVRTFCVCYKGYVTPDPYISPETVGEGPFKMNLTGVNGHSYSKHGAEPSANTNFALLARHPLTEPQENTALLGYGYAFVSNILGGRKPLIQRLKDIEDGRRSTWSRIGKSYVIPTLNDVTPGDISMAYPYRIVTDILESLDKLERVIPGVGSDSTLLYAPEIKFYSMRIETNKTLQTVVPNIFVAGDGAGVSRGITLAAATGMIAANGIKSLIK